MDNLFELIRKEEVIIWAGAGLSISAGYPSGKDLCKILYQSLSTSEKKAIKKGLLLPDLAEEIYRLKGNNKNSLIRTLKNVFLDSSPTTTSVHDKIALIPHFKTIITTNYDKLIENAYGDKAQLILSNNQIPYFEKNKTEIFKVHGDLTFPESIIITRSDYNKFFETKKDDDLYWTVITERLATKSVLFLGYNLEDPNVSVIFERISNALSSHRKECFLIAPKLTKHKVSDLTLKGIKYFNTTIEDFLEKLILNLRHNIASDLESNKISADSFRNFLSNFKYFPVLTSSNNSYKLKTIYNEDGQIEGHMNLSIKNNGNIIDQFRDFVSGKKIGNFEITKENLLKADLWLGGFKLKTPDDLLKIEFKSIPRLNTLIDVRFENGFEVADIPIKVYSSSETIEIHVELKNALITIQFEISKTPETKVNFTYKHNENCRSINEEIKLFTFLENLGNGIAFNIYTKDGKSFTKSFPKMETLLEEIRFHHFYFENLKRIEQYFNVRFSNINIYSISESTLNDVLFLISIVNGKSKTYEWEGEMEFELNNPTEQSLNEIEKINKETSPVLACEQHNEEFELHGQKIDIGYKMTKIIQPFVINLESFKSNKDKAIKVKSNNNTIEISYSRDKKP